MDREKALVDLGFTPVEVRVYLALLEVGSCSVTTLSDKVKLHRANVYDVLKKLVDKKIVSVIKHDNVSFFEALSPSVLLELLDEKKNNLKSVLPELFVLNKFSCNASDFFVVSGVSGFLSSINDLLLFEEEILVRGFCVRALKLIGARVMPFHKSRISKKIPIRQLFPSSLREFIKRDSSFSMARFFDFDSSVSIFLCGDTLILTVWSGDVVSFVIKNKFLCDLFRFDFNYFWNISQV